MIKHSLVASSLAIVALSFSGGREVAARDADPACTAPAQDQRSEGQRLFEDETFGGNGRTCLTCHSRETGTLSPTDAARRFEENPDDPLFSFDGSDDGAGHGVSRILADATILVEIPLPPNVTLADDPSARSVILRRGIPSTLNTPALDPVLMLDGRAPTLQAQAADAIAGHAQASLIPTSDQLNAIADFQKTDDFFTSSALRNFARGGDAPGLPYGSTESERRGRRFFEDLPGTTGDLKDGLCAACHSGPMLNQTNEFLPVPVPVGTRFFSVRVSDFNEAHNPLRDFIFTQPDGSTIVLSSPDPGRALITGVARGPDQANAFKIPSLRGVARSAPYFHDNSAATLEQLAVHYTRFFDAVSDPDAGGPLEPAIHLTPQDQADIVAFMKLL
jgi:cytochrome c peroxidase